MLLPIEKIEQLLSISDLFVNGSPGIQLQYVGKEDGECFVSEEGDVAEVSLIGLSDDTLEPNIVLLYHSVGKNSPDFVDEQFYNLLLFSLPDVLDHFADVSHVINVLEFAGGRQQLHANLCEYIQSCQYDWFRECAFRS